MKSDTRDLARAAFLEGSTLIALFGVAVPLKHIGGYPSFVTVMGTAHGTAFVLYWWLLIRTAIANRWQRQDVVGAAAAALVPFGGWFVAWKMSAGKLG